MARGERTNIERKTLWGYIFQQRALDAWTHMSYQLHREPDRFCRYAEQWTVNNERKNMLVESDEILPAGKKFASLVSSHPTDRCQR